MKHRCNNERATGYRYYGGRGIKLCERWNSSFQKFYEDMGVCPNGMSIERKDPNGNYCPENCIWATMKDQAKNKRNTIKYIVNGESITLSDLAKKSGIGYATLKYRIEKMQMSPDDAVRFKTKKK